MSSITEGFVIAATTPAQRNHSTSTKSKRLAAHFTNFDIPLYSEKTIGVDSSFCGQSVHSFFERKQTSPYFSNILKNLLKIKHALSLR
jgi:hypothetical protein